MYRARLSLFAALATLLASFGGTALAASDPTVKVVIHLADQATGTRINGRTVYLEKQDGSFWDIASAVTDDAGNATISEPLSPGTWIVRYNQGFGGAWNDAHTTVVITAGRNSYQVALPLTHSGGRIANTPRATPGARGLAIRVQGRTADGKVVEVHYAAIYNTGGREIVMTGYDGRANVRHDLPLGEMYELKAEANHWKTGTSSFTVGAAEAGSRLTLINDYVNFMLEPAENVGPPLIVEVRDSASDKPIHAATVTLYKPNKFPGTPVTSKGSDAKGEASFDSNVLDEARLNGAARVGVTASGYQNAVQDVTAELFTQAAQYTGGEARYLVYLKKKPFKSGLDMSGQWHFNWTWTVTSVDFVGTMTQGGATSFAFEGKVSGGGNAIWTAKEGSATCTLSGKPNAQAPPAKLTCSADFPGPTGHWSGATNGAINTVLSGHTGHLTKKIEYRGRYGKGIGGDGKPASVDSFSIEPK